MRCNSVYCKFTHFKGAINDFVSTPNTSKMIRIAIAQIKNLIILFIKVREGNDSTYFQGTFISYKDIM